MSLIMDNVLKSQAFSLKGRLYTLTVLSVLNPDRRVFDQQLIEVVGQAPTLFKNAAIVLDCTAIQEVPFDLQRLYASLRGVSLVPVAIQGGNATLDALAHSMGLAVLKGSSTGDKSLSNTKSKVEDKPAKTKILTTPIRSGQQVVSQGDLIITSSVSHGAELLANGHIHVYGALRGRALAGIEGDKKARIFCQSLDAELISIAGHYRLRDAIHPLSEPCQIFLQDDQIKIETL